MGDFRITPSVSVCHNCGAHLALDSASVRWETSDLCFVAMAACRGLSICRRTRLAPAMYEST